MNKEQTYLKFYIDSNGNIDLINRYIKEEKISLNEFNDIIADYLKRLESSKIINKLYLEYSLKFGNKKITNHNNKVSKRKECETIINIINNYIKEDKHIIKDYVINNNYDYTKFKKFINNYKSYYLTDKEKDILKLFLKRENSFNKDNLNKVKNVVDKISDDLVSDKKFDIYDYYISLGWDSKLLINYLKNNTDIFSSFIIDNVRIYLKKYNIDNNIYKLNDFIDLIKDNNKDISSKDINKIINYMNDNKLPYNYNLFITIYDRILKSE